MRKLLNSPWFVTVLALAALLLVGRAVLFAPKTPVPAGVVSDPPVEGQLAAISDGEGSPRLSVTEALKALALPAIVRDPFALPAKPEVAVPDPVAGGVREVVERLRLSAIWVQGSAVFLLLNGQICQPGDVVEHFTVEDADVEGVWIRHAGGRSFLPVGQELAVKLSALGSAVPLSP